MKEFLAQRKVGLKRRGKGMFALGLVFAMLCSLLQETAIADAQAVMEDVYQGNNFEVSFVVEDRWDGGYKAAVTVRNTGEAVIENWRLQFSLQEEIDTIWNATMEGSSENLYTIKNVGWNQDIDPGEEISFGFVAKNSYSGFPETFCLKSEQTVVKKEAYSVCYEVSDAWNGGFNASMRITNTSDRCIEDWGMDFAFAAAIDNIWNADISGQDGKTYHIHNASYNQNIQPGATVVFGFCCLHEEDVPEPEDIVLTQQNSESGKTTDTDDGVADGEGEQPEEGDEDSEEEEFDLELTPDTVKEYVSIEFEPGNTFGSVLEDVRFVNDAEEEMQVVWSSSDPEVVSETGKVTRQAQDRRVTITADIMFQGEKSQKNLS